MNLRYPILIAAVSFVAISSVTGYAQDETITGLRTRAEHGDADAQYRLGSMYDYGQGFLQDLQDDVEAVKWYRSAAKQGEQSKIENASKCTNSHFELGVNRD